MKSLLGRILDVINEHRLHSKFPTDDIAAAIVKEKSLTPAMFLGRPVEYWTELQALIEERGLDGALQELASTPPTSLAPGMRFGLDYAAFQKFTDLTAVYPDAGTGNAIEFMYIATGLAGEAGKVANLAKKLYRDGMDPDITFNMFEELGDAMWYAFRLCQVQGTEMDVVIRSVWTKLQDRMDRDVLHGRGSHR